MENYSVIFYSKKEIIVSTVTNENNQLKEICKYLVENVADAVAKGEVAIFVIETKKIKNPRNTGVYFKNGKYLDFKIAELGLTKDINYALIKSANDKSGKLYKLDNIYVDSDISNDRELKVFSPFADKHGVEKYFGYLFSYVYVIPGWLRDDYNRTVSEKEWGTLLEDLTYGDLSEDGNYTLESFLLQYAAFNKIQPNSVWKSIFKKYSAYIEEAEAEDDEFNI